jgi:hypothetical protein
MQKIDLLMDFAAGVYLSEAQNLIHRLPPPLTQRIVHVYTVYFFTQARGWRGGGLDQREG